MLYQFLLDDVARKQPQPRKNVEYVESRTEQTVAAGKKGGSLARTRSAPRRTQAFHYPLRSIKRDTWEDEAMPNSPTLPPFAVQRASRDSTTEGDSKRLTL